MAAEQCARVAAGTTKIAPSALTKNQAPAHHGGRRRAIAGPGSPGDAVQCGASDPRQDRSSAASDLAERRCSRAKALRAHSKPRGHCAPASTCRQSPGQDGGVLRGPDQPPGPLLDRGGRWPCSRGIFGVVAGMFQCARDRAQMDSHHRCSLPTTPGRPCSSSCGRVSFMAGAPQRGTGRPLLRPCQQHLHRTINGCPWPEPTLRGRSSQPQAGGRCPSRLASPASRRAWRCFP